MRCLIYMTRMPVTFFSQFYRFCLLSVCGTLLPAAFAAAGTQEAPQSPTNRALLGETASHVLRYEYPLNPALKRLRKGYTKFEQPYPSAANATNVQVAGSWDSWTGRYDMVKAAGTLWELDTRTLPARFGRHEFKFIVNDEWEMGPNRYLPLNMSGEIEMPSPYIYSTLIDDFQTINVLYRRDIPPGARLSAELDPPVPMEAVAVLDGDWDARRSGYIRSRELLTFVFDQAAYGLTLPPETKVTVAGTFNGWDTGGGWNQAWVLRPTRIPGIWEGHVQVDSFRMVPGENREMLFKFVLDTHQWLVPPENAPNARYDETGNLNLVLDLQKMGCARIQVKTQERLDLTQAYVVTVRGVEDEALSSMATPGGVFDLFLSDKPLGVTLNKEHNTTTYRLFAPRAKQVWLSLYDRPDYVQWEPVFKRFKPVEEFAMSPDPADGVWEITLQGLDVGQYYMFRVDGPSGDGENFDKFSPVGDPYARAAATANGCSLVVDPDATNQWFSGWTDQNWVIPDLQDSIIYECHVRGMTIHPSSKVTPARARGKYGSLMKTLGKGTGLDHLRNMGVNMIEFLPVSEFSESDDPYNWGYSTVFFFAPESSYASQTNNGAAYYEFKQLVNDLHNQGFGVILDVVYNHVGGPSPFNLIDKKYFFRLYPDFTFSNFSGVGNDVRSESPMTRQFIVDNILYFMKEFHIDGFRFDLGELIDLETMMAIRDAARELNPKVILISEPWSPGRGENKSQLRGTGWAAWNNDFRYAAKDFARGWANRDWLKNSVFGSVNTWALNPLQSINYLESHDDMAFMDEISSAPGRDGRKLNETDVAINRLAATVLFTSLGSPMLYEGQEFLRSKWGINNTYDKGDAVNAVRWTDRQRPLARESMEYYQGLMRLRLSDEGASFRVEQRPPHNYYRWIMPAHNRKLMGYVVNEPKLHAGNGFIVLLNSDTREQTIEVALPGDSAWKTIANGRTVNLAGIPLTPVWASGQTVSVSIPAISSVILMNGF